MSWVDLAKVLYWQRQPLSEIEAAYLKAMALLPDEPRFAERYQHWKEWEYLE
jgi:hypothetical protein